MSLDSIILSEPASPIALDAAGERAFMKFTSTNHDLTRALRLIPGLEPQMKSLFKGAYILGRMEERQIATDAHEFICNDLHNQKM
jgi:hypothetical protein